MGARYGRATGRISPAGRGQWGDGERDGEGDGGGRAMASRQHATARSNIQRWSHEGADGMNGMQLPNYHTDVHFGVGVG